MTVDRAVPDLAVLVVRRVGRGHDVPAEGSFELRERRFVENDSFGYGHGSSLPVRPGPAKGKINPGSSVLRLWITRPSTRPRIVRLSRSGSPRSTMWIPSRAASAAWDSP